MKVALLIGGVWCGARGRGGCGDRVWLLGWYGARIERREEGRECRLVRVDQV